MNPYNSPIHKFTNSPILPAAALCLAAYVFVNARPLAGPPIRSDGYSYYVYLPAWLLYHDWTLQAVADDCCGGAFPEFSAMFRWPSTGRWVNPHPIGPALLTIPFFTAAHLLTRWTNLSPDGFTFYYQHGAGLAGLFYVVAGLWILERMLRRYFSPAAAVATVATLLVGTSLFHYAVYDSTWSHPFSFFLFAAFLAVVTSPQRPLTTEDEEDTENESHRELRSGALVGLLSGLIVLTRHTNIALPLLFLVCAAFRRPGRRGVAHVAVAAAVALVVIAPQLALYKAATGHWILNPYGRLGFHFLAPQVWAVLFGPAKGLFFWAPLLLLACAGLFMLPESLGWLRAPIVLFLCVQTYLVASWWDWQFGASYGHRAFVDSYALLAPGLAAFYARVGARRPIAVTALAIVLCALSTFQMLQYWYGILPYSDTTWAQYRALFLRWR